MYNDQGITGWVLGDLVKLFVSFRLFRFSRGLRTILSYLLALEELNKVF